MFDSLTDKFIETFRQLSGKAELSDKLLDEVCRELKKNLLESDVHVKVVKDFIDSVREKAIGQRVHRNLTPEQQFLKIVYKELTHIMGEEKSELNLNTQPPAIVMMTGLQGSGKTTTSVKLAHYVGPGSQA